MRLFRPTRRMLQHSTTALALLLAPLAPWVAPATPTQAAVGDLYINEILFNPGNAAEDSVREYVELRGTPGLTMPNGTFLLAVEGDATALTVPTPNPGDVRNIFDLSNKTVGGNGLMVLLPKNSIYASSVISEPVAGPTVYINEGTGEGFGNGATSSIGHRADGAIVSIEDTSVSFFLVQNDGSFTLNLSTDLDPDDDGTPTIPAGLTILDSVGITDSEAEDFGYGQIVFRRNSATTVNPGATIVQTEVLGNPAFTAEYVARIGTSTGFAADEWVASNIGGTVAEGLTLGNNQTVPDSLENTRLNHVGALNPGAPSNPAPNTNCGSALSTGFGVAASRVLTARDVNSRVVSATITRNTTSPAAPTGAITLTNEVPAVNIGDTFSTTLLVADNTPINTYTYTVRFFNDEDPVVSVTCSIVIRVEPTNPILPACISPVNVPRNTPAVASLTAIDSDSTVTGATLVGVTPANPGITLGTVTPADGDGGTLSAALNINSSITGTFTATVSFSNDETPPQTATCDLTINVTEQAASGVTLNGGPASGSAPIGLPLTFTASSTDTNVLSYTFRVTSNLTTTALTTTVNANPATTTFTPTIEGVFTVTATANTGALATRTFTLTNGAPTALARVRVGTLAPTTTLTVPPTTTVILDGSGSSDAASDLNLHLPLTYTWTQVAQTGVPTVTLIGNTSVPTRTFVAPNVVTTTFTFQLVVADRFGKQSAPVTTTVTVSPFATLPQEQRVVRLPIILSSAPEARR
jgi:hypothetical protein